MQHPYLVDFLVKIDNEGKRKTIVRNGKTIPVGLFLAKRMGLRPKASDLFIAWPTLNHYGLWLEIKPDGWKGPRGKKEKEHIEGQLNFLSRMRLKGYEGKLVVGVDEGIKAIKDYLKAS
jgi:hypothetical protein